MKRIAAISACVLALAAAGCAERTLEPETSELAGPTTVSAQRYLADTAGAAESLREFVAVLDGAGPVVTDADARRIASELDRLAGEFTARAGRIERQRLEDQRLEAQRSEVADLLVPAIAGIQSAAIAAEDGDAESLADAATALRAQLSDLSRVGNR